MYVLILVYIYGKIWVYYCYYYYFVNILSKLKSQMGMDLNNESKDLK